MVPEGGGPWARGGRKLWLWELVGRGRRVKSIISLPTSLQLPWQRGRRHGCLLSLSLVLRRFITSRVPPPFETPCSRRSERESVTGACQWESGPQDPSLVGEHWWTPSDLLLLVLLVTRQDWGGGFIVPDSQARRFIWPLVKSHGAVDVSVSDGVRCPRAAGRRAGGG